MLSAEPKTQRFLELIQFILTFVSVCAVVDASRIHLQPDGQSGYYASVPRERESSGDRRIGDLARAERKRREAEQQASRRGIELVQSVAERQQRA